MKNWYQKDIEEVKKELETDLEKGLTESKVQELQNTKGFNELATKKKKSLIVKFLEQFKDFMIIVLIIAAIVSGAVGIAQGEGITDTIIILVVVIVNAIIGVAQENKAEKSLEALQKLSSHSAKVIRDGKVEIVPIEDNFVVKIIAYALKKDGLNLFCLEDFNHIIKQLNPTVSLHESYALAVYHDTISSAYNTKDTFNYFKEVDPLIEYPLHADRFSQIFDDVMNHLNDISNGKYFWGASIEDFSIEFKKLCDNGIKKEEDESQIIMSDKKKKKVY